MNYSLISEEKSEILTNIVLYHVLLKCYTFYIANNLNVANNAHVLLYFSNIKKEIMEAHKARNVLKSINRSVFFCLLE